MKAPRKILPALIATGALLLVAGCGDSDSSSDTTSGAAGNPVDRAFVADMIPHHESAVQMAQIARRRGTSDFVKQLADDIVTTQNAEITTLRAADQRLKSAGVTTGSLGVPAHMMGMDDDPASLKTATPFDRAFIQMMLPHHEGALTMANAEIAKGADSELKKLAQEIIDAQQREITAMRGHLGEKSTPPTEHGDDNAHGAVRPKAPARGHSGPVRASVQLPLKARDDGSGSRRGAGARDMPTAPASR